MAGFLRDDGTAVCKRSTLSAKLRVAPVSRVCRGAEWKLDELALYKAGLD